MEGEENKIPKRDVLKLCKLGPDGKKNTIYIFQGSSEKVYDNNELFSEIELEEIVVYNINIVYSAQQIHKDDSIRTIKKKIIQEIGLNDVCYDEIYLFSKTTKELNLSNLYQEITNQEKTEFTHDILLQLLNNLGVSESAINKFNKRDTYQYNDLLKFNLHARVHSIPHSFGQKFTRSMNYLFSANPFHLLEHGTPMYKPNVDNPLVLFDNHVALNYGEPENNTIFLCCARDVLEFAIQHHIQEEFIVQTYYPLLYNNGISRQSDFEEHESQLLKENAALVKPGTLKLYETVDMFYNMHYTRKSDIPYLQKGITFFNIVLHPEQKTMMPLEAIFKNIHATSSMAFIKYNPGSRKENIYRLYSEQISKAGKKIPYLSKNMVMNLSKQTGKSRQLSIFTQCVFKNAAHDFYIDLEHNGNIILRSELGTALSRDDVNEFIRT
jgi:hypothetical protein